MQFKYRYIEEPPPTCPLIDTVIKLVWAELEGDEQTKKQIEKLLEEIRKHNSDLRDGCEKYNDLVDKYDEADNRIYELEKELEEAKEDTLSNSFTFTP